MFNDGIVKKGVHQGVNYSIEGRPKSGRVILEFKSEHDTGKRFSPTDHETVTATTQLDLTCEQANQFAKTIQEMAKLSQMPDQNFGGKD